MDIDMNKLFKLLISLVGIVVIVYIIQGIIGYFSGPAILKHIQSIKNGVDPAFVNSNLLPDHEGGFINKNSEIKYINLWPTQCMLIQYYLNTQQNTVFMSDCKHLFKGNSITVFVAHSN